MSEERKRRRIDEATRSVIIEFRRQGKGTRWIAKAVGRSRRSVIKVLKAGRLPPNGQVNRPHKLDPHLDLIRELFTRCKRNIIRVAEELESKLKTPIGYSTLTRFCRRHRLGKPRKDDQPSGQYLFGPGVEQQHDTSPIRIKVGKTERDYQATSLKLGFSKNRYLQFYRRFRRFECKDFHIHALAFFGGSCEREMVDNTSVVVAFGTGEDAVMSPEMERFADRYKFKFKAHEKGDANRSAKVERDFDFIQRNFVSGRTFVDDDDLNRQAEEWCRKKNGKPGYHNRKRVLLSRLFEEEKAHLKPLPKYQPPECLWHYQRRVDHEGFLHLDDNLYSAPNEYLERKLTLKETMDTVTVMDGSRELCVHKRIPEWEREESKLPGHGRDPSRRRTSARKQRSAEESWLVNQSPVLAAYVQGLKPLGRRSPYQIRKLYALCHEYELGEVQKMAEHAATHRLFDVGRLEKMLLKEYGARLFGFRSSQTSTGEGAVTPTREAEPTPEKTPPTPATASPKNGSDGGDRDGSA